MTVARSVARAVASPVARAVVSGDSGSGTDADAAAYFAAVEGAGGSFDLSGINATYTAEYVKAAHEALFLSLKSEGLWAKITELYLLCGKTFGGLAIKAKGYGSLTNVNFLIGDWVAAGAGAGLKGDASTKRLGTGFSVNSIDPFDCHLSSYISQVGSSGTSAFVGGFGTSSNTAFIGRGGAGTQEAFEATDPTKRISVTTGWRTGFYIGSVRSSTDRELYRNGASLSTGPAGTALDNRAGNDFSVFANSTSQFSDPRIAAASIGTGLSDSDANNFTNAIETFLDAIGAGVIA